MNFWDTQTWSFILLCAVLLGSLIVANSLKQLIAPLRKSLIPSSVLGGLILLALSTAFKLITGDYLFNLGAFTSGKEITGMNMLENITYHCLAIGFIAMSLKQGKKKFGKKRAGEIFDTGVTTVSTYLLQAFFGIAVTIGLAAFVPGLIKASGIILALGYGQGTGQALNYGTIYEEYGLIGGDSFGLAIAALGFLSASIFGVVYLNSLERKGLIKATDEAEARLTPDEVEGENEIPMSASVDKFTVQVGFIICSYAIAYLVMYFLGNVIGEGMRATIYGFNFLLGTLVAVLLKWIYNKLRARNVIKREYINNFMLSRISGFAFDVMIVAGIAAIQIDLIADYWYTLLILGLLGAGITYMYLRFVCKKLFPEYEHEQFLAMFGMLTGTASTGMILLREADKNFSSPASENLVYQNFPAIVFGFPIMLIVSYAPTSDLATYITLAVCISAFIVMNIVLFRRQIFKKK